MDSQFENTNSKVLVVVSENGNENETRSRRAKDDKRELSDQIEQQSPGLLKFIRRQVATVEDAEDLLQDVLTQFTIAFEGIEAIEQTASWLFRVAKNRVTDWYRSRKGKGQVSLSVRIGAENNDDESLGGLLSEELLVDERTDPDSAYWQEVLAEELDDAVAALPDRQQQVFIWHEFNGLSFADMAEITGETENTLRMQKHYAMRQLRTSLNDYLDLENTQ